MVKNKFKLLDVQCRIGGMLLIMVLLFVAVGCKKEDTIAPMPAKSVKKAPVPIQAAMTSEKKAEYTYDPIGKRDPFRPFIELEKKTSATRQQITLAPLQLYDLGELRLVGVIMLPGKKVAMVEDPTGKGYNVKEGTLIGKNEGKVVEIKKDEVVVEEKYIDETARTKTRNSFLKIQREQGGEVR